MKQKREPTPISDMAVRGAGTSSTNPGRAFDLADIGRFRPLHRSFKQAYSSPRARAVRVTPCSLASSAAEAHSSSGIRDPRSHVLGQCSKGRRTDSI